MSWLKVTAGILAVGIVGVAAFVAYDQLSTNEGPELEEYLEKYKDARYRATYDYRHVYIEGEFAVPGPYVVYKDGERRARVAFAEATSVTPNLIEVFATRATTTTCVERLQEWATPRFGLSVEVDPVQDVCFESARRSHDDPLEEAASALSSAGAYRLTPIDVSDFAVSDYAKAPSRDIADREATCFFASGEPTLGGDSDLPYSHEVCFSDGGALLYSRYELFTVVYLVEATDLDDNVGDQNFELPYRIVDFRDVSSIR